MSVNEAFKELLTVHVAPGLKEHGFRKKGQTFGCRGQGVWKVINFQKSQWSDRDQIEFTVNLGIWVDAIAEFRLEDGDKRSSETMPAELYCHWRQRIGRLLPEGLDTWWDIGSGSPVEPVLSTAVIGEVHEAISKCAVPLLKRLDSGEQLYKWDQENPNPSVLTSHRLCMFKLYGSRKEFELLAGEVMHDVQGKEWESLWVAKLRRLGYKG